MWEIGGGRLVGSEKGGRLEVWGSLAGVGKTQRKRGEAGTARPREPNNHTAMECLARLRTGLFAAASVQHTPVAVPPAPAPAIPAAHASPKAAAALGRKLSAT